MAKPSKSVTIERSPADVRAVAAAIKRVQTGANELLLGLYDFGRLKGWEVTGHASFADWAATMDLSTSTAYRKLSQGAVLAKMLTALGLGTGDVSTIDVPVSAQAVAKVAQLPVETFTATVQEVRSAGVPEPEVPRETARRLVATVKPDRVMPGPRVGAKFRQLTLALDSLTAEVVPDDRQAVAELHAALGVKLAEWGML